MNIIPPGTLIGSYRAGRKEIALILLNTSNFKTHQWYDAYIEGRIISMLIDQHSLGKYITILEKNQ